MAKQRLCIQLLDHEPRAGDQVPLLLAMKEDRLALTKAIDSGDTDLGTFNLECCRKSQARRVKSRNSLSRPVAFEAPAQYGRLLQAY